MLCTETHILFTRRTHKEAKAQDERERKVVEEAKEDEMVNRGLAEVQSSEGRRGRKMTKKAMGGTWC